MLDYKIQSYDSRLGDEDVEGVSTEPRLMQRQLMVFMCHASSDKGQVRDLCERLRNAGFDPWLDDEKLMPGADWQEKIDEALHEAGAIIVCLSKTSVVKDGFVQQEIRTALNVADEKKPGSTFIFPVKLDDCETPRHLRRWQWAELSRPNELPRLVAALKARAQELDLLGARSGELGSIPSVNDSVDLPTGPLPPLTIAVMGTKGGVGKGVFVSFASQLLAAAGGDVAVIDLDLAASGTTLAAEGEYGHTKPSSILTAFDHVARKATNIGRYSAGHSEELWDITPSFLENIRGGRIWLLPAREPANPGQSFDVVANVLPPEQREEKLVAVVQEQIDRICEGRPKVRSILVDCGAERNPIYGAAFSKADAGYILLGPNPEYFGEVKAVRDELLRMFHSIDPSRVYAVANNVTSIADEQRCKVGISPIPLLGAISSDTGLQRAKNEGLATHIDLGHEAVAKAVRDSLDRAVGKRRSLLIDAEHIRWLPIVSLFLQGGGLKEFSGKLRFRLKLAAGGGVVAAFVLVALGVGRALTTPIESSEQLQFRDWLLGGVLLALALLVAALRFWAVFRSRQKLLAELGKVTSNTHLGLLTAVSEQMKGLKSRDPRLAKSIQRWVEGRQHDERKKR